MVTAPSADSPRYFATLAAFRDWLAKHHASRDLLWVGFHKRDTGVPSLTWPESVDAALCFGWIDGIRKRVDERRYTVRFTPRRPGSNWSAVNVRRMRELIAEGVVHASGLAAFERRKEAKRGAEAPARRRETELPVELERELRADPSAWAHFASRPPGYRRTALAWVTSAKQEATRRRRLRILIESSRAGRPIPPLARRTVGNP